VSDGHDALLYEQVNDPDTRRRLRAARAPRNWHTGMLRAVAPGATGTAILYADLMRVAARRVDRLRDRRPALLDDPQFARAYANCSGLCVPHMVPTIAGWPGTPHDYRNTEPISESEAAACATVLEMVAGGPGVFGNDLHADDVGGRRGR